MRGLPSSFSVWASHCAGFSSCKAWARGAWHQRLQLTGCKHGLSSCVWHMHLVALRHVESSWTRDQTHVPCIGRRILPKQGSPLSILKVLAAQFRIEPGSSALQADSLPLSHQGSPKQVLIAWSGLTLCNPMNFIFFN